jgi:hypothetical protein
MVVNAMQKRKQAKGKVTAIFRWANQGKLL